MKFFKFFLHSIAGKGFVFFIYIHFHPCCFNCFNNNFVKLVINLKLEMHNQILISFASINIDHCSKFNLLKKNNNGAARLPSPRI